MSILALSSVAVGCDQSPSRDELVADNPPPADPEFDDPEPQNAKPRPGVRDAEAKFVATKGDDDLEGEVEFSETGAGVRITAQVSGAEPGLHGIHVHERGDCTDLEGGSMGGHYAPDDYPHALPDEANQRHLGDLGNIEVDEDGEGKLTITIGDARLNPGDPQSFTGRSIVLHRGADQGKAHQPSGDSGPVIACGVIELD